MHPDAADIPSVQEDIPFVGVGNLDEWVGSEVMMVGIQATMVGTELNEDTDSGGK